MRKSQKEKTEKRSKKQKNAVNLKINVTGYYLAESVFRGSQSFLY